MKLFNQDKIILDLCGGTGSWSKPYKDAGYDVRNITLPEYDIVDYIPPKEVYGILAAPPCTQFSLAAGKKMEERNTKEGMQTVNACIRIIFTTRHTFWALENPVGYLRVFLGSPQLTFRQWEYGDKGIKPTDIWGEFNLPSKKVLDHHNPQISEKPKKEDLLYISAGGSSGRSPRKALGRVDKIDAVTASITPPGFAKTFFEVNK